MPTNDLSILVHLAGFLTGAALYAMLGVMALRERGIDRMALSTAALGVTWNVGGLLVYGVRDLGIATPPPWAVALSFAALGFLPAVVVHAASRNLPRRAGARWLAGASYLLSGAAAAIQLGDAALSRTVPSRVALQLLSAGYVVITAALAMLMLRQPGWRRALSAVALAAFAVMALHLSQHGSGSESWWVELAGHHASIPLALAILYQDYRFALADLFLRRVLILVGILLAALALYMGVMVPVALPRLATDPLDPRGVAVVVSLWLLLAAAYPVMRAGAARLVDRVVLGRVDYQRLTGEIAAAAQGADAEDDVLGAVCRLLAPALSARCITWSVASPGAAEHPPLSVASREGWQEAAVHVPTTDAPSYTIALSEMGGGRVLLSGDLRMLETAATLAGHRIDAVRLTRERIARSVRENEIMQLATEAELRALRAQLNPHFLFNALTTIGYLMREAPERALDTLYRLTGLLRAVLRRADGPFVTLAQELEIVESYLAIERARFEERLRVIIDVPPELARAPIPPLLLQPIVENAIKHGIAPLAAGGSVTVSARRTAGEMGADDVLLLVVRDTGLGAAATELARRRAAGIGLSSVERRLERQYGSAASLVMRSAPGEGTIVELRIPMCAASAAPAAPAPRGAGRGGAARTWERAS